MCKFNYMVIADVIIKGGVVLDHIILRGVSDFFPSYLHIWAGQNIRNISHYDGIQHNTTTYYDLNVSQYDL